MQKMTLDDIKGISLDILTEFHDFCIKHSLKYSLGYGTAIGAVRHQGFIPWDDDVDICMLRPDYERFCAIYQDNSDYKLFAPQRGNTLISYARLCEIRKTEAQPFVPCFKGDGGVWIDIFPMDLANDDYDKYYARHMSVYDVKKRLDHRRDAMRKLNKSLGLKGNLHVLLQRITCPSESVEELIQEITHLCTLEDESCRLLTNYHSPYRDRERYLRKDFDDTISVKFEGREFCLMSGYDDYLSQIYGDYMKPPPVEKRKSPHSRHLYWWK